MNNADIGDIQAEAYAEGRKDEREQWLPVLEALKEMRDTFGDRNNYPKVMQAAVAVHHANEAIKHIEGGQP